jgi:hypothetical protein
MREHRHLQLFGLLPERIVFLAGGEFALTFPSIEVPRIPSVLTA